MPIMSTETCKYEHTTWWRQLQTFRRLGIKHFIVHQYSENKILEGVTDNFQKSTDLRHSNFCPRTKITIRMDPEPQTTAATTQIPSKSPQTYSTILKRERAFRIILGPATGVRIPALIPAVQRPQKEVRWLAERGVPLCLLF